MTADDARSPAGRVGGARPRYVRRVTVEHVGQRVSVRHLVAGPAGAPVPTDVVGRLLALDDDAMLLVDRDARLHVLETARVVASRVVPPHPRLPAEPDVGRSEDQPLVRQAARVLLLDPQDRVLLVSHAPDAIRRVWTAPGGGLEPGETHEAGARRELHEELGLRTPIGPWVFSRRVVFAFRSVWIDQDERWFLARAGGNDLPDVSAAPLDDAGAIEARWWTLDELAATSETLAPARLVEHVRRLVDTGPPDAPIDVGR